jgi:hypothetical protein
LDEDLVPDWTGNMDLTLADLMELPKETLEKIKIQMIDRPALPMPIPTPISDEWITKARDNGFPAEGKAFGFVERGQVIDTVEWFSA